MSLQDGLISVNVKTPKAKKTIQVAQDADIKQVQYSVATWLQCFFGIWN